MLTQLQSLCRSILSIIIFILCFISCIFGYSCEQFESFAPIAQNIVNPSAITTDGEFFFVVNADHERKHNQGSILTLSSDGEKLSYLSTPRLGRFIVYKKPWLIVGHSWTDQYKTKPMLRLYDASDPHRIKFVEAHFIDCTPINVYAPEKYRYFAVGCDNGIIYLGKWKVLKDREDQDRQYKKHSLISIHKVRDYGPHARRALYIDVKDDILYAFASSDSTKEYFFDQILPNEELFDQAKTLGIELSLDKNDNNKDNNNENYDQWFDLNGELSFDEFSDLTTKYQFGVYDIKKAQAENFKFSSKGSTIVKKELRWLYFHTPLEQKYGFVKHKLKKSQRYFRTNFFDIKTESVDVDQSLQQDLSGNTSFLISQKGVFVNNFNQDANAVYRFIITKSPWKNREQSISRPSGEFLQVQKVWANKSQDKVVSSDILSPSISTINDDIRYTSNFIQGIVGDKKYLIVNDFRYPERFSTNTFSLTLSQLPSFGLGDSKQIFTHEDLLVSFSRSHSFFALSAIEDRVLTGAFYGNNLTLIKITDDLKWTDPKIIK